MTDKLGVPESPATNPAFVQWLHDVTPARGEKVTAAIRAGIERQLLAPASEKTWGTRNLLRIASAFGVEVARVVTFRALRGTELGGFSYGSRAMREWLLAIAPHTGTLRLSRKGWVPKADPKKPRRKDKDGNPIRDVRLKEIPGASVSEDDTTPDRQQPDPSATMPDEAAIQARDGAEDLRRRLLALSGLTPNEVRARRLLLEGRTWEEIGASLSLRTPKALRRLQSDLRKKLKAGLGK